MGYTIVKWKTLRNLPDISTKKILENIELFGIFLEVAGNIYIMIIMIIIIIIFVRH